MSRTYRNSKKDGTPNEWVKVMAGPSPYRSKDEGLDKWSVWVYTSGKFELNAPAHYRRSKNRSRRSQQKMALRMAIINRSENAIAFTDKKDVNYNWF